ncbi:MAG: FAD-binding oxidoreductase [Succinivibrio sp.]|nr:FAD-binding oxidoreductase [Succinivibrio sp.]
MKETRVFPEESGVNGWFETNRYKNRTFADLSQLQKDYDYVIVGAGFAGVNAAFRLAELRPDAAIALLDCFPVGYFSSGRNAGFIVEVPHASGLVTNSKASLDDYRWRYNFNRSVIARMKKIIDDHALQLDWVKSGAYKSSAIPESFSYIDKGAKFFDALEIPYSILERDELKERLGTDFYLRSIYTPNTVLVNPSEVVRGLATILPQNVTVFENTAVKEVKEGAVPSVILKNGTALKAGKVILTVSGFLKHFGVKKADRVFAIHSFGGFTRELDSAEIDSLGSQIRPYGTTSAHPAGATVRLTSTRRILVRTVIRFATYDNISEERLNAAKKGVRRAFERRFPSLAHVPFEYFYGGYIPFTMNSQPFFGQVGENVFAGAVGEGAGVTRASTVGLYLADLIEGVDSEELRYVQKTFVPSYIAPEPFRTIGANARILWDNIHAKIEV